MARLFVALWPDPGSRARLAWFRDAWSWPPTARPEVDERLHLTLHFIGAFAGERIDVLSQGLAAVAAPALTLTARGPELWGGGIAVLRLHHDPALQRLHGEIGAVLSGLGVPLDLRPFSPHVTLARRAARALPPGEPFAFEWRSAGFALVESTGGRAAAYQILRTFDGPA